MRHSSDSRIGIIDTGDMVLVRDPSKTSITTYVDGYGKYSKFGDYGDVVVYSTDGTPVIHRAIVCMEHKGGGKWSIPSLAGYGGSWDCTGIEGGDVYSGTLTLFDVGYKDTNVAINLNTLASGDAAGTTGYITMGDNNSPNYDGFVADGRIVAVAAHEIPWLGCIKLFLTGNNTDKIPTNSIMWLIVSLVSVVALMIGAFILYDRLRKKK
jgi:signal peptidase